MNEEIFIKLRDCFTAGYTLPQYCIDNGIKKPLFVSEEKFDLFLWEVFVQFYHDRRIFPLYSFIDNSTKSISFHGYTGMMSVLYTVDISSLDFKMSDAIILLTKQDLPKDINITGKKTVRLIDLERFFILRTYIEIPLLHFLQRYPTVKLFLTNFPGDLNRYKDGKKFASQLYDINTLVNLLSKDKSGNIKTGLDKFGYTNEQVLELIQAPKLKRNIDGTCEMLDDNTKILQRIQNGKRVTAFKPDYYKNKIYFFGGCHFFGVDAPFDKTIESYLQKMLNEHDLPYCVENESQYFAFRERDMLYNLNKLNPKPNDIIFFCLGGLPTTDNNIIPFIDVSDALDAYDNPATLFAIKGHLNELGYKLVAEKYFKFLTENNFFRDKEFNYPLPPHITIDMVYLCGLNRVA